MKKYILLISIILISSCTLREMSEKIFLDIARESVNNKEYQEALRNYNIALKINPENVDTWLGITYVQMELKELQEALNTINKAINIKPTHEFYYRKSTILGRMENYKEALIAINNAISLSSSNKYIERRATLYSWLRDIEKAITDYQTIYNEGYIFNTDMLNDYTTLLIETENYDQSLKVIDIALLNDSLNSTLLKNKGLIFDYQEKYNMSIPLFEKALSSIKDSLSNDYFISNAALENAYYHIKNYEKALHYNNQLLKLQTINKDKLINQTNYDSTLFAEILINIYLNRNMIMDKIQNYVSIQNDLKEICSIFDEYKLDNINGETIAVVYYLQAVNEYKLKDINSAIKSYAKAFLLDTKYKEDVDELTKLIYFDNNEDILKEIAKSFKALYKI